MMCQPSRTPVPLVAEVGSVHDGSSGKPTVVLDFYGLNYTFYDDAPGVIVLRSHDQLAGTLTRLFSDRQHYSQLAEAQHQQASEWILLDGRCTKRVVEGSYRLIENPVRNRLT